MVDFRFPHKADSILKEILGAATGAAAGAQAASNAMQMLQENDQAVEDAIVGRLSGVAAYASTDPIASGGSASGTWDVGGGQRPYTGVIRANTNSVGEVWVTMDGGDGHSDGYTYAKSPASGSVTGSDTTLVFGHVTASYTIQWVAANGTDTSDFDISLLATPLA